MTLPRIPLLANIVGNLVLPVCATVLFFLTFDQARAAREVSEKRECATCHVMWLKEFKQKEVKPLIEYNPKPIVDSGKQDVSSTEKMCFSCHDGFVLDSRFMWREKSHSHPVGNKPPRSMRIPTSKGKTIFPLNDDGKVYCGTCHSAHGVDWQESISPIFLRARNVNSSLCLACHLPMSEGPEKGMHPIFEQSQHGVTDLSSAGSRFASDGSIICESCHRTHGAESDTLLVKNNQDSGLCQTCHERQSQLVGSKHDMKLMAPDIKNKHGKTSQESGPCSACHTPHAGKGAAAALWARKISKDVPDLAAAACLECHNSDGVAKEKATGEHSHPLMRPLNQLGIETASEYWRTQPTPTEGSQNLQILPLFDKYGHRDPINGQVSCATCHDPHNWTALKPTKNIADKTERHRQKGDGNSSFLRIAQGKRSTLCLNCHLDQRALSGTPHDLSSVKTSENAHSENKQENPARIYNEGFCETCHQVHNARGERLRARDVGPGKQYIETWCQDCHRQDGIAGDKVVSDHSHPLGVKPVHLKSKDTSLPLFASDGEHSSMDGMVDCATCHDPHVWTQEVPSFSSEQASILVDDQGTNQEKPEGDAHSSFLRMSAAGDSLLCIECHEKQGLAKGTDHDMRVTGKSSINQQGQNVEQSGFCGQCHTMHNSVMNSNLWAQIPGKGADVKTQQCSGCHSDRGIAKNKTPDHLEHPEKVVAWSNDSRHIYHKDKKIPDIPVYDQTGEKQHRGQITCASCHNPHQWSPGNAKAGTGKNEEGNVLSSFLRNANSENIVCADCHGKDSLFRYKYFHGDASRKKYPLYQ